MGKNLKRVLAILLIIVMQTSVVSMIASAVGPKQEDGTLTFDLDEILEGQEGTASVKGTEDGLNMNMNIPNKKTELTYDENVANIDVGDNLSYIGTDDKLGSALYKVNNSSNVRVIERDAEDTDYNQYLNAVLNSKPMTDAEKKSFLTKTTSLVKGKANSWIEENNLDSISFVNSTNAASDQIVVVNLDAIAISVKDVDGKPISDAIVTVRYTDDAGTPFVRSVKTTNLGAAVFDQMQGTRFGAVDIQHPDYHSVTIFDTELTGGTVATEKFLAKKEANELYVRGADLDGLDMLDFTDTINLSDHNENLTYTVLVSKTGTKSLPKSVQIRAKNAGKDRLVAKLEKTESIYADNDTAAYSLTTSWVKQGGLFRDGDEPYYMIEGPSNEIKPQSAGFKVVDAKVKTPTWLNTSFGFFGGTGSYTFDKDTPGIGGASIGVDLFQCPVQFAVLTDGTVFISYGLNIKSEGTAEMMQGSWKPKDSDQAKTFFKKCQDDFQKKWEGFKEGKDIFINKGGNRTAVDYSTKFKINLMFTGTGGYNKLTGKVTVSFGAIISVMGSFGLTWYLLIPVGPIVIPAYAGFNASATAQAGGQLAITFDVYGNSSIEDIISSVHVADPEDAESNFSLDIIVSIAAYAGIGIHDMACFQFDGSVYLDAGIDFVSASMFKYDQDAPRFRVTGGYSVGVSATFLWFKYSQTFLGDKAWLYDSWGAYKGTNTGNVKQSEPTLQKVDTEAAENNNTLLYTRGSGEQVLKLPKAPVTNDAKLTTIDSKTLNNSVLKTIETKDYTLLFRLMTINGRVHVVYQYIDNDGNINPEVHSVKNITKGSISDTDISSYDVVVNGNSNRVNIAAIAFQHDTDTIEERTEKTIAGAITVDVSNGNIVDTAVFDTARNERGELCRYRSIFAMDCSEFPQFIAIKELVGEHFKLQSVMNTSTTELGDQLYISGEPNDIQFFASPHTVIYPSGMTSKGLEYDTLSNNGSLGHFFIDVDSEKTPDGKNPITAAARFKNKVYAIGNGELVCADVWGGGSQAPESHFESLYDKDGNAVSIDSTASSFQFSESAKGNLCLTGLAQRYDENGKFAYNELVIYRIDENNIVHGPQKCKIYDDNISGYCALPDSRTGAPIVLCTKAHKVGVTAKGLVDNATLYEFKETPHTDVNVTSVAFTETIIDASDETIPFIMTVTNNGTSYEKTVDVIITDENGPVTTRTFDVNSYPGETVEFDMSDTKKPSNWATGIHTVTVKTNKEAGNGYKVTFDKPYVEFNAEQRFVNGKYMAYVSLRNLSAVNTDSPVIQVVGQFKGTSGHLVDKVVDVIDMGSHKVTFANFRKNGIATGQSYNTSFCLDDIWNKYNGTDEVLYGVKVRLAPKKVANGTIIGEEATDLLDMMPNEVYFDNPITNTNVNINAKSDVAIKGAVEGAGDYKYGETATLKAVSNYGNKFVGWYDGDKLVSTSVELKVDAVKNANYTAKFVSDLKSVKLDDVTVKKGKTITLNPVIDALDGTKYTVEYTSSNEKVAVVDENGVLTAVNGGVAIITCTVTDEYGNKIQDTCLATVQFPLWQRIVRFVIYDILRIDKIFGIGKC